MNAREIMKEAYLEAKSRSVWVSFGELSDQSLALVGKHYSKRQLRKWSVWDGWYSAPIDVNESTQISRRRQMIDTSFKLIVEAESPSSVSSYSKAFCTALNGMPEQVLNSYMDQIRVVGETVFDALKEDNVSPRSYGSLVSSYVQLEKMLHMGAGWSDKGVDVDAYLFGYYENESS